jgi:hypothetical protein
MKYFLLVLFLTTPAFAADNSIIKKCQVEYNYNGLNETKTWSDIATCIVTAKNKIRFAEEDRIWEFVKANPHYRYPGIALPAGQQKLDPSWGLGKRWRVK